MAKTHGGLELAEAVKRAYEQGQTDYYLKPMVRLDGDGKPVGKVKPGDTVIFCCRRGEREIELTDMFVDPEFDKIERRYLPGVKFSILTMYHDKFKHLPVAFAPESVENTLASVLAAAGKTQLHCAESEKYAHVTFFFNGGHNEPFPGETDIRIPSPKGVPFDQAPALSLPEVTKTVIEKMGGYDFTVVNFANGDVVGHTASSEAKLKAASCVSEHLQLLTEAAQKEDAVVIITADHGNIETLLTPKGKPHVAHTKNLVPVLVIDGQKGAVKPQDGALCDIAPTVLHAMGVAQPAAMGGKTLVPGYDFGGARRVLLVILDGWGRGSKDDNDALHIAQMPYWHELLRTQPFAQLQASGEAVGLCAGKAGNSEAGHMNLGAGRVVPQDDLRLERAMADGTFAANPVFVSLAEDAVKEGKPLHLIAYLTHASSHGSIDYPLSILGMAKEKGLKEAYVHVIFDGRSTEPGSAPELLAELEENLAKIGLGEVVDGFGRGLALDRDGNYDKVKLVYDAMVEGAGDTYR